jgi:hypothetical protein
MRSRSTGVLTQSHGRHLTGQSRVAPRSLSSKAHITATRLSACPWYAVSRTMILHFTHGPRALANWNLQLEMTGVAAGSLSSREQTKGAPRLCGPDYWDMVVNRHTRAWDGSGRG